MIAKPAAITAARNPALSQLAVAAFVALIGLTVMGVSGHVQAATLHDAAHDARHATGFPCH